MKVGDLVKHRVCGLGLILCDDIEKHYGDYLVLFPTNKHKKVIKARRSWMELISEGR